MTAPDQLYGDAFYEAHDAASLKSARIYLKYLWDFIQPKSVADVGCGRGTWLKAAHELGCDTLIGLDGAWNNQSQMIDPVIKFQGVDLNNPFNQSPVDLAISLEVAEHLEREYGPDFVGSLSKLSDAVLFSAAYPAQGGVNHLNERPHTYWAGLFAERGFLPFDLFRPTFWGDENVSYWYRQNTFLYARQDGAAFAALQRQGVHCLHNPAFMDCIHPSLYHPKIDALAVEPGLIDHIRHVPSAFIKAVKKRLS